MSERILRDMTMCLLALALLLGRGPAVQAADGEERTLGEADFRRVFAEIVLGKMVWSGEDLEIEQFQANPSSVSVPAGPVEYRHEGLIHPEYLGRKTLKLTILVGGTPRGETRVSGDVQLYGAVVCTARQVGRGHILASDDIVLSRRNISYLGADLLNDPDLAIGKKLRSSLRAGVAMKTRDIDDPPLVKRGDVVTILARSEALRITVPGLARNGGAKGDLVKVKNLMSRREVFGTVADANTVLVDF